MVRALQCTSFVNLCCDRNTCGIVAATGSSLLAQALKEAEQDENIKEAYLHVQSNNHEAMEFYAKCGFDIGETTHNYYRRLNPPDAVILRYALSASPNVVGGLPVIHN